MFLLRSGVIKQAKPNQSCGVVELKKVPYGAYGSNASTFLSSSKHSAAATSVVSGSVEVGKMLTEHLQSIEAEGLEKWGDEGPPPQKQGIRQLLVNI